MGDDPVLHRPLEVVHFVEPIHPLVNLPQALGVRVLGFLGLDGKQRELLRDGPGHISGREPLVPLWFPLEAFPGPSIKPSSRRLSC